MRLPYIPADPQLPSPADQAIVERVKQRRGGALIGLDRALLHAPPVADGWNAFLGAVRTGTTLAASLRETAICRVAVLNRAWYEWEQHARILEGEGGGGMAPEAVRYVRERPVGGAHEGAAAAAAAAPTGAADGREKLLDEKHLAVLDYTDAMTLGCVVPEPVFQRVKALFSDREVVEITSTVAAYNCVSRFLVALDVGEMAEKYGIDMSGKS